jgi:hypothetical protein
LSAAGRPQPVDPWSGGIFPEDKKVEDKKEDKKVTATKFDEAGQNR